MRRSPLGRLWGEQESVPGVSLRVCIPIRARGCGLLPPRRSRGSASCSRSRRFWAGPWVRSRRWLAPSCGGARWCPWWIWCGWRAGLRAPPPARRGKPWALIGPATSRRRRPRSGSALQALNEVCSAWRASRARPRSSTSCFRHAHSIKGSAQMVGLDLVSRVAHGLEDALGACALGQAIRLSPSPRREPSRLWTFWSASWRIRRTRPRCRRQRGLPSTWRPSARGRGLPLRRGRLDDRRCRGRGWGCRMARRLRHCPPEDAGQVARRPGSRRPRRRPARPRRRRPPGVWPT